MASEMCLTCLCKPEKAYDLNEVFLDNLKILEILHQLVPLFLEQQIFALPERVCSKCLEKLIISYKFQKQCLDSLQNLNEMFSKNSLKKETEQQNVYEKLNAKDVALETNECKSSDENTMESLPKIKEDLSSSLHNIAIDDLDANKANLDTLFEHGHNMHREKYFKPKKDVKSSLKFKLQSTENSKKNLLQRTQSENIEETSIATKQCKICNKIFKQPQGLASHMSKTHFKKHLYQCQKCDKGFSVEELFIRHCNMHLGIKPFPCTQCDKAFETNSRLSQHLLCHSKESSYSCTICDKTFHRIDVLKQHMLRHDDEKQFQCTKCGINFTSFSDHIKHIKTHKTEKNQDDKICDKQSLFPSTSKQQIVQMEEKLFKCDQCDKGFNSLTNLKLHMKTHNRGKSYQCKFCSKAFCQSNDLRKHTRRMHKIQDCEFEDEITMEGINENKEDIEMPLEQILIELKPENKEDTEISQIEDVEKFSVKLGENEGRREKELTEHRKTLSDNVKEQENSSMASTENAQCDLCNQIFKNPQGLARHRSSTHFKRHLYQCDQCDRGFSVEEFYIKHRNRHLGIKMFKCNQCDKAFETNSILNQHLISHSKLTPHLCTTCGKSFRRLDGLRQHMLRHGDERPFKCSVCSKSFKCLSDKLKHMIIHDEKRYVCNICGTRLATPESLSQHQMTHTGEKPFKCSHCDKSFISLSNMKCHERIHTGEKPYKCQYCWKTFRQSNDRNKHTNRMHKKEKDNTKSEQNERS